MNRLLTITLLLALAATAHAHGPVRASEENTRGWQLMTPEERTAQQVKMREVKTYDECKVVQTEHRSTMEARAKEKGLSLFTPRGNACDNLKARGLIL